MKLQNPILKIAQHTDFSIPVIFEDDAKVSYLNQIKVRFAKISHVLDGCSDYHFEPSIKENITGRVKGIQDAITEVINQYLSGHPSISYNLFKNMLEDFNVKSEILGLQQFRLKKGSKLFRAQREHKPIPKSRYNSEGFLKMKKAADLFHPPFQKRRSVSTNRFSISGYPCLYLSESLKTSFSECYPDNNETKREFNCMGLQNLRPLYFLDLSDNRFEVNPDEFPDILPKGTNTSNQVMRLLKYLGIYHLVIASHTKISYKPSYKEEKYFFKAEYIIPQLLLQWLNLEGFAIDGIRYTSCTGARRFPGAQKHYNYVLPVRSNRERGFCPSLSAIFMFTPVYSCFTNPKTNKIESTLNHISKKLIASKFSPLH